MGAGDTDLGVLFLEQARRREQAGVRGTKYGLTITVAEGFKPLDRAEEVKRNLVECNLRVDFKSGLEVCRRETRASVSIHGRAQRRDFLRGQGKSDGMSMPAETIKQLPAGVVFQGIE